MPQPIGSRPGGRLNSASLAQPLDPPVLRCGSPPRPRCPNAIARPRPPSPPAAVMPPVCWRCWRGPRPRQRTQRQVRGFAGGGAGTPLLVLSDAPRRCLNSGRMPARLAPGARIRGDEQPAQRWGAALTGRRLTVNYTVEVPARRLPAAAARMSGSAGRRDRELRPRLSEDSRALPARPGRPGLGEPAQRLTRPADARRPAVAFVRRLFHRPLTGRRPAPAPVAFRSLLAVAKQREPSRSHLMPAQRGSCPAPSAAR